MKPKNLLLVSMLLISQCALFAQIDARWLGTWKSDDGKTVLIISKAKIDLKNEGSQPSSYAWAKDEEALGLGNPGFGQSDKALVPSNLPHSQNFKAAVESFWKDPSNQHDYYVRDPKLMLQAIKGMPPGACKGNLWIYDGGDAPASNYFVNGDRMLELFDGHYGYSIKLFSRTERPGGLEGEPRASRTVRSARAERSLQPFRLFSRSERPGGTDRAPVDKKPRTVNITEGAWTCEESNGECTVFHFETGGTVRYYACKRPDIQYRDGTWEQHGNDIAFQLSNHFAEYTGLIMGSTMEGKALNRKGSSWTWVASIKN